MTRTAPHNSRRNRVILLLVAVAALALSGSPPPESSDPLPPAIRQANVPILEAGPLLGSDHEEQRTLKFKTKRPPRKRRPPSRVAPPRPKKPGPKKARSRPKKSPMARSYPKAKPRKKRPEVVAMVEPKPSQASPTITRADEELEVGAEVSWDSLPASGPSMNGHLMLEIGRQRPEPTKKVKRNLVVLIDVSGSMRLPPQRIATPIVLMMDRLGAGDRGAVVAFSDRATVFPSNTSMFSFQRGLAPLTRAPSTNLLAGLNAATTQLRAGRGKGRVDQLVLLTDGITGNGRQRGHRTAHESQCIAVCERAQAPVTILGYGNPCNRELLMAMARRSGGEFTYVYDVAQLLEKVMGDVLGLSGVVTRNNRLIVTFKANVKVSRAFLLGPDGRELSRPEVHDQRLEIYLGDLREGETLKVILEVVLPGGQTGILDLAEAQVRYEQPDGGTATSSKTQVKVNYSESWNYPRRNRKFNDVVPEIQRMGRK